MRKLFVAVAALGMLLTSCAKDADVVTGGNESLVSFKVSQPKLGTRAATGTHDATQTYGTGIAAEALQYAIFEVKNGQNEFRFEREDLDFFAGDVREGTLTERLVNGKTYIAVFWADAEKDKYYTVDWENGTISFVDATKLNAQDENLDAFYGMTVPFKVEGPSTVEAELRRPFAQLNISTTDSKEAAEAGLTVETSYIKVSKVYTAFNFWTGEVDADTETEVTFAETGVPKTCIYNLTTEDGTAITADLLSLNYLLVNEKKNVDVEFHYASTDQKFTSEYSAVPVQRNYRTHIVGDLLTDATNFHIIINPEFDGEHIYDVYDNILDALKNGGSFTLTDDITVAVDERIELSEAAIIDLNGYTLTIEGAEGQAILVRVNEGGSVTFKDSSEEGKGAIEANIYLASANKGGVVTVEGGNYSTSGPTLFQANGGQVYIKGGHFEVTNEEYGATYLLNHIDSEKNNGLIEVTGGQFVGFNPADAPCENPRMNFVKEGHASYVLSTDADGVPTYEVIMAADVENITVAALAYQNAKLTWDAVANADHYVVKYGEWTSEKITAAADATTVEYDAMPAETVKDSRKPVFTVEARTAEGGTLAVGQTAGDVEIFTLFERPVPEVRLANGALTVATDLDYAAKMGNAHLYGVMLAAEVYFYKDGAATPTYTAKATAADQVTDVNQNYATAANNDKKMKGSNMVKALTYWQWAEGTGAFGSATNVAPAFEPGTYTMAIKGHYFPTVGAYYSVSAGGNLAFESADRIVFTGIIMPNATNGDINATLNGAILREDAIEGSFSIASVEGIAAARNGYKGIEVTWNAVTGATSYEVVADGQKATVTEAKAQFTAADTQHAFTNFSVTALDANGAVVAVGNLAAETQVWNIDGVQPLTYTFDGSNLVVSGANNLIGTAVHVKVEFVKDGTVAYTAEMDKTWESTTGHGGANGYNMNGVLKNKQNSVDGLWYGRFTNDLFAAFPGKTAANANAQWAWNGTTPCDAPTFEPGDYTVNYTAYYYPIVDGFWSASSSNFDRNQASGDRAMFVTEDCLAEKIEVKGSFDNYVVGFNAEAMAAADILNISWNSIAGATYEVYVNGSLVGETTDASYTYEAKALGDYNVEVKVKNTEISATASATVNYLFAAFWTAPKFSFTGTRLMVTELMNIDNATHFGYAYGGQANTESGKSTIEIYKDGTLLYTLTNTTIQSNLNSWAGWMRWNFDAQDNRKDWVWTNTSGTIISVDPNDASKTEADVPAGTLTAGTYTLKWTIGYVVTKNTYWSDGTNNQMTTKDGAKRMYFAGGLSDVYGVGGQVATVSKSGETTLVVE